MSDFEIAQHVLNEFPANAKRAVVVMSGGMDSAIAARFTVETYGADNVHALSFFYGQKQSIELEYAASNCAALGIKHTLVDLSFLGDMVQGVCANIVGGLAMPTSNDVLGDPAPTTEVPFRNGIMFMLAAAYAQANDLQVIITGIQAGDHYGYFDTTPEFIDSINGVLSQNRKHSVQLYAPWKNVDKATEIAALIQLDDVELAVDLLKNTITCYNPTNDISCGDCPSCGDRIANFKKAGIVDPIQYAIDIDWTTL